MQVLLFLSNFIVPLLIFYIVGFGLLMKKNVYEDFVTGAEEGFKTVIQIMPTLIGLMVGVGILRASGFLDWVSEILGPITEVLHFPSALVPLTLVRMFSASAATSLALDIFKQYGADSYLGTLTSIIMSCTETIFYTMSVYYMAAKVKKTRWTLAGALGSMLTGIIVSVILGSMM